MQNVREQGSARPRVLFLCSHNSARSQIAEGLLRHDHGDAFEAASAGTEKTRVKPMAARVLEELGIDVSGQFSKTVDELEGRFDIVVTVCDQARDSCPWVPARVLNLHRSFEDPSDKGTTDQERLRAFRQSRDEIRRFISGSVQEWLRAAADSQQSGAVIPPQ